NKSRALHIGDNKLLSFGPYKFCKLVLADRAARDGRDANGEMTCEIQQ
ncbi:unnamed protein product, partial [Allacma fusca]